MFGWLSLALATRTTTRTRSQLDRSVRHARALLDPLRRCPADRVFASVVFTKHTRSIEKAESPITEVSAYRQRSCFVVADYRLAPEHRALDSDHPGLLRFGRVQHWVCQSPGGRPVRAVVKLYHHLNKAAVDRLCSAVPDGLGREVWRAEHLIHVEQFDIVSIPVMFCTRGTVIAMHVQRLAREQGLAFCLPSLPREY